MSKRIRVVGAGLAGCESAYRLLKSGYEVELVEMRPQLYSAAHRTDGFAELVCSNSLKSKDLSTSSGLLKEEMRELDSLVLKCAEKTAVPAGGALAVDRALFSAEVERVLRSFDGLTVERGEYSVIDTEIPTIIATGPLTSDTLAGEIEKLCGDRLHFYDAVAPIVSVDSLDMNRAFYGARYGKGGDDYLNCPMTAEEYQQFYDALVSAQTVPLKSFEQLSVFEGCMPVEVMAARGVDAMRYGPLRPVGLTNPDGTKPYAVVQLRKENVAGDAVNLVGFQTNLTFAEQKRVFSMIPALHNAEFLRFGVMHRNTYLNSPLHLTQTFCCKDCDNLYFAGQMTGVEGYMESAMSGILAAIHLDRHLKGLNEVVPSENTLCGALSRYVATTNTCFQPMNSNFGLLPTLAVKHKKERYAAYAERALNDMRAFAKAIR